MLVLTRKTNQSIMIGDDIEVSVLAVSRDKIRLGITAPRDVPVFRKEVYISIKAEEGEVRAPESVTEKEESEAPEDVVSQVADALEDLRK